MKTIFIVTNPLDASTVTRHDVDDICEFLCGQFSKWPNNAKIYNGAVAVVNDVTPAKGDVASVDLLNELDGPFYVICYPGDPLTLIAIVAAVISIALTAYTLLSIPNVANKNNQSQSPSNTLSDRTNEARVKARIPDIYGTVRSTPDLIQVPYRIFDSNSQELELCYMCISRGELDIIADNIFDGDTPINEIDGESVEVYGPNTSPNGGSPQLTIGDAIGVGIISVQKSNSVNGQTLYAPNYKTLGTECSDIYFTYDPTNDIGICNLGSSVFDFTKYFEDGDQVVITGSTKTVSGHTLNFDGTYVVGTYVSDTNPSVQNHTLRLLNASTVKSDWVTLHLDATTNGSGPILDAFLVDSLSGLSTSKWVGPFNLTDPDLTGLLNNFIALNGLYKTDGNSYVAFPISVEIGVISINSTGDPIGSESFTTFTLPSSAVDRSQKALSALTSISGRVAVRAHRLTLSDYTYDGQVIDTVQWRDLYGTTPVSQTDFGNVTTIQCKAIVTPSSLGVKERKINLICTRKVPARIGSTNTFGALAATNSADAIICAIALDPYIGNRSISELDVSNIYETVADVVSYFGISNAAEFCYTFDSSDLSFEEALTLIANTIFCVPYRQGQIIRLTLEQQTDDSVLLFNHRNILPTSETRTVRFGNLDNADGIEYTYVDPDDESVATIYIPSDESALKPQTIDSVGIRNVEQATLQANRAYNKLLYQNITTQFNATQEADIVIRSNRILVADTTRSDTQAGQVLSQSVLELELSEPFVYTTLNHTIFLQLYDGSIQAIGIASADASPADFVTLALPPSLPLATDNAINAPTMYEIVSNSAARKSAFLVDSKDPGDKGTSQITALNYDARYYANDFDFK